MTPLLHWALPHNRPGVNSVLAKASLSRKPGSKPGSPVCPILGEDDNDAPPPLDGASTQKGDAREAPRALAEGSAGSFPRRKKPEV